MKILILLSILGLTTGLNAHAFGISSFKSAHLQLGTWLENYGQVQANRSGETNGFEITPYLSLGLEYDLQNKMSLLPEIGYVFQRTDEAITKNQFLIRGDFAYQAHPNLRLRLGSSLIITSFAGDGGEDTLRNGNSTEVYYIPEERKNTYNQTLDFGVEYLQDRMSIKLQNYIFAWNEEEERMTTYSLSLNYFVPIEELL